MSFCRSCSTKLNDKAIFCTNCGVNPNDGSQFCQSCGEGTKSKAIICVKCGVKLSKANNTDNIEETVNDIEESVKKFISKIEKSRL